MLVAVSGAVMAGTMVLGSGDWRAVVRATTWACLRELASGVGSVGPTAVASGVVSG